MKSIGIITIHKINNYGSVLQAYALQRVCEDLGYKVEIIDYTFPNAFHKENKNKYIVNADIQSNEPRWIKLLYAKELFKQHRKIMSFVHNYQNLSSVTYNSPMELRNNPPHYDIYITGSDQLWSPKHCNGDSAFLLQFAPDDALKISYAASIGSNNIPIELQPIYRTLLQRYRHISVRENSGVDIIRNISGKDASVVLDPTLLLDKNQWNQIATPKRLYKKKYILCYFLNYSFNAFPYVDELAEYIQKQTGYEVVRVARPPHRIFVPHMFNRIDASPEDFLALVRDAEMILTTSFHGTAFAVNYGKPFFTIIQDLNANDSRQVCLMQSLGLENQILSIKDAFPSKERFAYDYKEMQIKLERLRDESKHYLINALRDA